MMAPAAPLIVPEERCPMMRETLDNKEVGKLLTRKHGVLLISVLEMMGSVAAMAIYIYALAMKPAWYPVLVPIPDDLCNAANVVHGVMYIIILLCAMELVLAVYLFEGARREKLGRIRFWLSSMVTYLGLVTIVILGMDLGGIRCPTMNSAAFINIFIRFMEMMVVYAWAEQESMIRKLKGAARLQHQGHQGLSTLTICTMASTDGHAHEDPTPPPSYSSTIPSRPVQQQAATQSTAEQ